MQLQNDFFIDVFKLFFLRAGCFLSMLFDKRKHFPTASVKICKVFSEVHLRIHLETLKK